MLHRCSWLCWLCAVYLVLKCVYQYWICTDYFMVWYYSFLKQNSLTTVIFYISNNADRGMCLSYIYLTFHIRDLNEVQFFHLFRAFEIKPLFKFSPSCTYKFCFEALCFWHNTKTVCTEYCDHKLQYCSHIYFEALS